MKETEHPLAGMIEEQTPLEALQAKYNNDIKLANNIIDSHVKDLKAGMSQLKVLDAKVAQLKTKLEASYGQQQIMAEELDALKAQTPSSVTINKEKIFNLAAALHPSNEKEMLEEFKTLNISYLRYFWNARKIMRTIVELIQTYLKS